MSVKLFTRSSNASGWVERDLLTDQWSVTNTLNERSTATLTLLDETGAQRFLPGHGVRLEHDTLGNLFEGFVQTASEGRLGPSGSRVHTLDCHDLTYLLDKRVVIGAWTNTNAGQIVRAIIASLEGEGLTAGFISAGASVRAYTSNYRSAASVLQDLADRSNYWWRVNPDRSVDFLDATVRFLPITFNNEPVTFNGDPVVINPLPWGLPVPPPEVTLTPGDALADSVSQAVAAPKYRNRQWIRGGRDTTQEQVEVFAGDGATRTFPVGFPVAKQPRVEVNRGGGWVTESVGPAGISTGRDWYFTFGSVTITQDPAGSALQASDRVRVTYQGLFSVIARVDDHAGQAELRAVEGGSGIVEHVLDDRTITTRAAAFELGGALLEAYGEDSETIRFTTTRDDLRPGLLADTSAFPGSAGEMLITNVEHSSREGQLVSVVTLAAGPLEGSWARWFTAPFDALAAATTEVGGEVDVITTALEFSKEWEEAERPNIYFEAFPGASVRPGAALVPAFTRANRVRYLAWHAGGVEVGRKRITTTTDQGADPILTTTVLTTTDAVGAWSHLSWWGGDSASSQLGSGVLLERVEYPFSKTNIEVINVNRTDEKGW